MKEWNVYREECLKGESNMAWLVIVMLTYLPIFYRIHKRLDYLEEEVKWLKREELNDQEKI